MAEIIKKAGGAVGKAAEVLNGVAKKLTSEIEVREQTDPIPLSQPQQPELGQTAVGITVEAPAPQTLENDPVLQQMVLDYEQTRAPGMGRQDPLRLANGQTGEDAIRMKYTPTDNLLRSYLRGTLAEVRKPEFQEKIRHQAAIEGRDVGEFKDRVETLATIMAYPPQELLKAVDIDRSPNQLGMLQHERKLVDTYATLKSAESGYNMGVLFNDPALRGVLAERVTPEERLAMEATITPQFGGMGIWKTPSATVKAAIKLVEAAPKQNKAYLDLVEAMVAHVHEAKGRDKWAGDVTAATCHEAANKIEGSLRQSISLFQKDHRLNLPQVPEIKDTRRVRLPFGKAKKDQQTTQREHELERELAIVDHFAVMELGSNRERPGKDINDYFKHYNGHLLVWDGHQIVSKGIAPEVPERDVIQASRVFCDYVVPHALRNAPPEVQHVAQLRARCGMMFRELGQQHEQTYPKVTEKELQTVARLPTREQLELVAAARNIFRASGPGVVMAELNKLPAKELQRMLDELSPQQPPQSPKPPTLER